MDRIVSDLNVGRVPIASALARNRLHWRVTGIMMATDERLARRDHEVERVVGGSGSVPAWTVPRHCGTATVNGAKGTEPERVRATVAVFVSSS